MLSDENSPIGLNFLQDYHIVIVELPKLVGHVARY